MFGLCTQSLYYILLSIIVEVCAILIIGYDQWIEYFKKNYLISLGGVLAYLIIIQLLCFFNKNTIAWILFWFTFALNTISLLYAISKNMPEHIKKEIDKKQNNISEDDEEDKDENTSHNSFEKSANKSCKSSCGETCEKNPNKPIDFDCNSYCNAECNKIF